ncbi:MAG: hypothetical protein GW892_25320 [Armatimonadetes bacterium]|nr:hypothetical protein [Armatimonadota bacterium]
MDTSAVVWSSLARTLFVVTCVLLHCASEAPSEEQVGHSSRRDSPERLARRGYSVDRSARQLALWRKPVTLPRLTLREWDEFVRKHGTEGFPNIAFVLVDASRDRPEEGHVAAVVYRRDTPGAMPPATWCADLSCADEENLAYIALGSSTPERLDLALYQADVRKNLGQWPLQMKYENWPQWPSPVPPLSRANWRIEGRSMPRVSRVRLRSQPAAIVVEAEVDHPAGAVIHFRFDLESQRWSAVAPAGIRVVRHP